MSIIQVKKRVGTIVPFDRSRIELAIKKAFRATETDAPDDEFTKITDTVIAELERFFGDTTPSVEQIQDIVERQIAEHGYFDVAKAYILYRSEREAARSRLQQELYARAKARQLKVKKRDGSMVDFDITQIEQAVMNCNGHLNRDAIHEIVEESLANVHDGITTRQINKAVLMAIKARIERDPAYSKLAARFLYNDLYKEVLGVDETDKEFSQRYMTTFSKKIKQGVEAGRYDPRLLDFDLPAIEKLLKPERDQLFHYLGAQTLYDRYFVRDHDQNILEIPQYFWLRIAMGLSINEKQKNDRVAEFYDAMSQMFYVPSTPTLFHAGTHHPQMSSCYLTTVEDDLDHIFKCIGDNAQLSKWSGGLGNDWTNIRGTGSLIKSTNVGSQGVIPFLKIVDSTTAAINRSGKRRGATCVYLETWHYDIEAFIELRKNTGDDRRRTHDINTANWIPDLFMKRVMENGEWTLFSPDETPDLHHIYGKEFEVQYEKYEQMAAAGKIRLFKKIPAVKLWRKIITMMFETGHPWITFKDPCNVRSPQDHVGVVHSSNLCTEITLNTSRDETAVCNLGSINLPNHVAGGTLNKDQMRKTVKTAMRMLDNVIDLNFYPTPEAENANMRHRPVGLGVMGYEDLLFHLDMTFDSDEAAQLSDEIMEFISYYAILGSSELAKERGAYQTYKGSKWDRNLFPIDTMRMLEEERDLRTGLDLTETLDWTPVREHVRKHGMRNSNTLAIAPTATIANITGCLPSIEPIYKNLYVKSNVSGEFTVVNRYLIEDLKKLDLWNDTMLEKIKYFDGSIQQISEIPAEIKAKYKEVFEIDTYWIVKHGAHRSKWIDQSQSVNIFTSSDSGSMISDVYLTAWKMGLKTTYYLRTLGASAIEKSTLDINKKYDSTPTTEHVTKVAKRAPATVPVAAAPTAAKVTVAAPMTVVTDEECEACQ